VPYPNLEGKHAHDALVSAEDFVRYWASQGRLPGEFTAPTGVVMLWQRPVWDGVLRRGGVTAFSPTPRGGARPTAFLGLHTFDATGGAVGVIGGFGIGAPAATVVLESLAALGVRHFVGVGTAGALVTGLEAGDVVVCSRAVRDEGVSHHYLPPGRWAEPSPALTARLTAALDAAGLDPAPGASWTVDAPYRETVVEAEHYVADGAAVVEMEAAALYSVGRVRGVDVASAFAVSDSLAGGEWVPHFAHPRLAERLGALVPAAVDALVAMASG
jgi:uridine phosphorylase